MHRNDEFESVLCLSFVEAMLILAWFVLFLQVLHWRISDFHIRWTYGNQLLMLILQNFRNESMRIKHQRSLKCNKHPIKFVWSVVVFHSDRMIIHGCSWENLHTFGNVTKLLIVITNCKLLSRTKFSPLLIHSYHFWKWLKINEYVPFNNVSGKRECSSVDLVPITTNSCFVSWFWNS